MAPIHYILDEDLEKNTVKLLDMFKSPSRAPVAINDSFPAINDCFSLANYNDWPRW